MSNEVVAPGGTTGGTAYYLLFDSAGQIYNALGTSTGVEPYATGDYVDYAITLTELGSSGIFVGDLPAGLPKGIYGIVCRMQAGASPAEDDVNFADGTIRWDGSQEEQVNNLTLNDVETHGDASWATAITVQISGTLNTLDALATHGDSSWATATGFSTHTAADAASAVEALVIETGYSLADCLRIVAAAVAGKVSGAPGSPVFKGLDGVTTRITGTADSSGNRTAASYSP